MQPSLLITSTTTLNSLSFQLTFKPRLKPSSYRLRMDNRGFKLYSRDIILHRGDTIGGCIVIIQLNQCILHLFKTKFAFLFTIQLSKLVSHILHLIHDVQNIKKFIFQDPLIFFKLVFHLGPLRLLKSKNNAKFQRKSLTYYILIYSYTKFKQYFLKK